MMFGGAGGSLTPRVFQVIDSIGLGCLCFLMKFN